MIKNDARTNRERLTPRERPAILVEIDKTATDARMNMARLREQRLAKEAESVRTKIVAGNHPEKAKRRRSK
jgi:hypothetical protein